MSDVLNEETLVSTLDMVGGDVEFMADLVSTYRTDGEGVIRELRTTAANGARADLQRAAHTLKGASASLGAEDLAELCRGLEADAKEGRLDGVDGMIEAIAAAFEPVVGALEAWVAARSGDGTER